MYSPKLDPRATFVAVLAVFGERFSAGNAVGTALFDTLGSPTLLCVLGSHIFFNLYEAAERNVNLGTNWSSYPQSILRFNERMDSDSHEN